MNLTVNRCTRLTQKRTVEQPALRKTCNIVGDGERPHLRCREPKEHAHEGLPGHVAMISPPIGHQVVSVHLRQLNVIRPGTRDPASCQCQGDEFFDLDGGQSRLHWAWCY